jgi:hypothetical protein
MYIPELMMPRIKLFLGVSVSIPKAFGKYKLAPFILV